MSYDLCRNCGQWELMEAGDLCEDCYNELNGIDPDNNEEE